MLTPLYTRPAMSARQAQRHPGRIRLRGESTGCADLNRRRHWAHRILDTVAAGMDVKDGYVDRALRILGDLTGSGAA